MKRWSMEEISKQLDAFRASDDPNDPKERKRLHIVSVASDLFFTLGYRKTSMDQVAHRAGVAKGTVYLYFKTKAELLLHAIIEEKRCALGIFAEIISANPEERLKVWLQRMLVVTNQMPLTSRLLTGDRELIAVLMEIGERQGEDWSGMQQEFLQGMVKDAAKDSEISASQIADRAKVLMGIVYFAGQLNDPQIRGGLSVERFAEIFADIIANGICAGPSK